MTNNEGASGSGDESSAENKVPSPQEGEGDDQAVNAPVPPHASLPRRRQEELLPRPRPSLVHVQLGALRPRGATMPTPRPPPPPTPRAPQHAGEASGSGGKAGSAFRGVPIVIGGGIQVGGRAEGALGVVGIPSEAPRPHKRKSDVLAPFGLQPICRVCNRDFLSWKALFGHLRSHPDRDWRGCFPPPVEGQDFPPPTPPPPPLPRPAHPPIAINVEPAEAQQPVPAPRGLGIDLNEPHTGADADADANADADAEADADADADADAGTDVNADAVDPLANIEPADIDINRPPPADDEDTA